MSRNIPRVRLWRVTYFRDVLQIFQCDTHAPTKLFARWNARDVFIQSGIWRESGLADKIQVGLIRKGLESNAHREMASMLRTEGHGSTRKGN
jgi:hypothetical protein